MSISSILRYASRLLWLTALFSTFPIYAASSNHPGGMTGTLTSGSAEVISTGNIRYFGIVGRDDFYDPSSGDSERESRLLTGVTFGLSSHLEMGVGVSFAHGTSPIATGTELRYLRGHAKYVFYGSRARGSAAAVSIYSTTAELPDNLGLTSGNANSGLELIYSQLGLEGDTTYALGLEHRDYKTYNTGTFTYSDVPVLSLSASHLFRTELKRNYELGLKTESASVGNTEYGNIYLNVAA
ncbi:MAG: hypothetical protein OEX12_05445, partial [Gammaproteobacteria bacterium]|nr:hypothetical protein [Gammaproteobacteria bacterium]